ncbi:MAG: hypothetical protein ABIR92_08660 [Gemmatimonadaceae bacterium]
MRPKAVLAMAILFAASCSESPTVPTPTGEQITLSQAQIDAMGSRAQAIADNNPGNSSLRSFIDSTLQALQAGVQMKRLDVTTNLTEKPLYFVGIHRLVNRASGGSFSTWTLVGFEDPAAFANVVQTSGFAQSSGGTAPTAVSGTIGDGTGIVNGQLLQVAANGSVATFNYSSGTASFRSDAPSGACPLTNPAPATTCSIETMHVRFNVSATQSPTGSLMRNASITGEMAVPAMRLTYTPSPSP